MNLGHVIFDKILKKTRLRIKMATGKVKHTQGSYLMWDIWGFANQCSGYIRNNRDGK